MILPAIILCSIVLMAIFVALSFINLYRVRHELAKQTAKKIVSSLEDTFPEHPEVVFVSPESFTDTDLRFYEESRTAFEALNYRLAGDMENLILTRKSNKRIMIRALLGHDGRDTAFIYETKPTRKFPAIRVIELRTEFDDGSFVTTTTAPSTWMAHAKAMLHYHVDAGTTAEALVNLHRNHVERYLADGHTAIKTISSVDEMMASSLRASKIGFEFRRSLGFGLSEAEKKALSVGRRPRLMRAIFKEMDRLIAEAAAASDHR